MGIVSERKWSPNISALLMVEYLTSADFNFSSTCFSCSRFLQNTQRAQDSQSPSPQRYSIHGFNRDVLGHLGVHALAFFLCFGHPLHASLVSPSKQARGVDVRMSVIFIVTHLYKEGSWDISSNHSVCHFAVDDKTLRKLPRCCSICCSQPFCCYAFSAFVEARTPVVREDQYFLESETDVCAFVFLNDLDLLRASPLRCCSLGLAPRSAQVAARSRRRSKFRSWRHGHQFP